MARKFKPAPCVCGAEYDKFKSGYTYDDALKMLWVGSDDPELWQAKGKGAVMRLLSQLKRGSWDAIHGLCKRDRRPARYIERARIDAMRALDAAVPF